MGSTGLGTGFINAVSTGATTYSVDVNWATGCCATFTAQEVTFTLQGGATFSSVPASINVPTPGTAGQAGFSVISGGIGSSSVTYGPSTAGQTLTGVHPTVVSLTFGTTGFPTGMTSSEVIFTGGGGTTSCSNSAINWPAVAPPPAIVPTLGTWGLIILGLLIVTVGAITVFKGQKAPKFA